MSFSLLTQLSLRIHSQFSLRISSVEVFACVHCWICLCGCLNSPSIVLQEHLPTLSLCILTRYSQLYSFPVLDSFSVASFSLRVEYNLIGFVFKCAFDTSNLFPFDLFVVDMNVEFCRGYECSAFVSFAGSRFRLGKFLLHLFHSSCFHLFTLWCTLFCRQSFQSQTMSSCPFRSRFQFLS